MQPKKRSSFTANFDLLQEKTPENQSRHRNEGKANLPEGVETNHEIAMQKITTALRNPPELNKTKLFEYQSVTARSIESREISQHVLLQRYAP